MTTESDKEFADQIEATISAGITENAIKALSKTVTDIMEQVEEDIVYRLRGDLAPRLTGFIKDMAERSVVALLEGNEREMQRYLHGDGAWTGRSDAGYTGNRALDEWHPIIHGKLFESGYIELRKKIVEAHRELLVNQRILDLEDQVKSLVAQVNKADAAREAMWRRVQAAEG